VIRRWLNFDAYIVRDLSPTHHPGPCVAGYMEWFQLVSHPYIVHMPEDDRPSIVVPMILQNVDHGHSQHGEAERGQAESPAMVSYLYHFVNIIICIYIDH